MEYDAKYRLILPKNNKFMELVVKSLSLVFYNVVRETLNKIRRKIWIAKSRNNIRRIIETCVMKEIHFRILYL